MSVYDNSKISCNFMLILLLNFDYHRTITVHVKACLVRTHGKDIPLNPPLPSPTFLSIIIQIKWKINDLIHKTTQKWKNVDNLNIFIDHSRCVIMISNRIVRRYQNVFISGCLATIKKNTNERNNNNKR